MCFHRRWPCLVCRAQSKTRYLHQHPSEAADLVDESYTWEQDDLYERPLNFELAMLATEHQFFDPWTVQAFDHYRVHHVPSYLARQRECTVECNVELGGCITCAEYRMLLQVVGQDDFDELAREVVEECGMCLGCWGFHGLGDE